MAFFRMLFHMSIHQIGIWEPHQIGIWEPTVGREYYFVNELFFGTIHNYLGRYMGQVGPGKYQFEKGIVPVNEKVAEYFPDSDLAKGGRSRGRKKRSKTRRNKSRRIRKK